MMLFLLLNRLASARDAESSVSGLAKAASRAAALTQSPERTIIPALVASSKKTAGLCGPIENAANEVKNLAEAGTSVIGGRLARLTAYWSGEGDYYTRKHMSATGVRLHAGHCAVDPSIIPYGSVVQIAGLGNYLAVDTGTAVVSRRAAREAGHTRGERNALVIDLYFDSRSEGEEFAATGPKYASISWSKPDGDLTVPGLSDSELKEEAPIAAHKPVASNEDPIVPAKSRPTPATRVAVVKPSARKESQVVTTKPVSKHDTADTIASSVTRNSKGELKLASAASAQKPEPKAMAKADSDNDRTGQILMAQEDATTHHKSLYQF